jgi:hypothetical protein
VVQTIPLFVHVTLGRDAATAPSLGRECDAGNTRLHIRETHVICRFVGPKVLIAGPGVLYWARHTAKVAAQRPFRTVPALGVLGPMIRGGQR